MGDIVNFIKETEEEKNFVTDFDFENDTEFATLLSDTLSKEFDEAGISVSDNLIAVTMKKINALKEAGEMSEENGCAETGENEKPGNKAKKTHKGKPGKWLKVAAGIAAACFIGVIGIAVVRLFPVSKSDTASDKNSFMSATVNVVDASEKVEAPMSAEIAPTEVPKYNYDESSEQREDISYAESADSMAAGENPAAEMPEYAADTDATMQMYDGADEDAGGAYSIHAAAGAASERQSQSMKEAATEEEFADGAVKEAEFADGAVKEVQPVTDDMTGAGFVTDDMTIPDTDMEDMNGADNGSSVMQDEKEVYETRGIYMLERARYTDFLTGLEELKGAGTDKTAEMTEEERSTIVDESFLYAVICCEETEMDTVLVYQDRIDSFCWPAGSPEGAEKTVYPFGEDSEADAAVEALIADIAADGGSY